MHLHIPFEMFHSERETNFQNKMHEMYLTIKTLNFANVFPFIELQLEGGISWFMLPPSKSLSTDSFQNGNFIKIR